ncbi:Rieske 2Fe-2S domain-containing protein [Aquihabitans sp. G128]|uniref:Rieske 2Fe-2S domain-containing protein n=1 Tax=Aquihabitans sp. G128 TaxID=2849779 RepID=UPI001C244C28|nr:Rieske 2Fe-2S domain-containing protein [Aquihabitans sp. G128]QXC61066.1 Rieske 2Fe-2S domain-containing protein [Aquihabitans sp. G128]
MTPEQALAAAPAKAPAAVPVEGEAPEAFELDGQPMVRWTDAEGCTRVAHDRCPHRRAPLSAGYVADGVLRCRYHGWGFGGDGRCVDVPALGPEGRIPPRARLEVVPSEVPVTLPAAPTAGSWLDGDTPGLERFWHQACRLGELAPGASVETELLGTTWTLSLAADGATYSARTAEGAEPFAVQAHLDHLWLAPTAPLAPLPEVPEWGQDGWHLRRLSRAEGRFGVGLLLDNQLDAGHFAFVHTTTFGTPDAARLPESVVERDGTTVTCTMRVPIAARNLAVVEAEDDEPRSHRTMHYAFHAPLWLRLQLDYEEGLGSTILLFGFVPQGPGRARMDLDILFRRPEGFTEDQLDERLAFEEQVVAEDLHLQRLFHDLRLPLDPAAELHTKADRYSLTCRHLLRDLLAEAAATV